MNKRSLVVQNEVFAGTNAISTNNRHLGFMPAFRNNTNGNIALSRMKGGRVAPLHLIDWLPLEWAEVIDINGAIKELVPGIEAGFVRNGKFYSREEMAHAIAEGE